MLNTTEQKTDPLNLNVGCSDPLFTKVAGDQISNTTTGNNMIDIEDLSTVPPNVVIPHERLEQEVRKMLTDICRKDGAEVLVDKCLFLLSKYSKNDVPSRLRFDIAIKKLLNEYRDLKEKNAEE